MRVIFQYFLIALVVATVATSAVCHAQLAASEADSQGESKPRIINESSATSPEHDPQAGALEWANGGGTLHGLITGAFPSTSTPWQDPPIAVVAIGHTAPWMAADSKRKPLYLGMPYGPETGGLGIENGRLTVFGTTYGWSGAGDNNDLLDVFANAGHSLRGTHGYSNYAARLSYGQADSHTVSLVNRQRAPTLVVTGLTAKDFTTDNSVSDPSVRHDYIYRIVFPHHISAGLAAGLVPGDTVFTSNGYMALIVKANTSGVDVDNWTRGLANVARDGHCQAHGPSVQPTDMSDAGCLQDLASAGTLTAYIGTQTTFEPLYLESAYLPSNPIAGVQAEVEFVAANDAFRVPTWNDSNPIGDYPFLAAMFGGAGAENAGSAGEPASPGRNGVGAWGVGMMWNGAFRRAFVVNTTTIGPPAYPYKIQPLCGLCITQSSTVMYGIEDDRQDSSGAILAARNGRSSPYTTVIDKRGNMSLSGQLQVPVVVSPRGGLIEIRSALRLDPVPVEALPRSCLPGAVMFATNGRKPGEAPGRGTGVPVYCDMLHHWIVMTPGQAVSG